MPTRFFWIDNSTQGLHAIKTLKQHITNLEYITNRSWNFLSKIEAKRTLRKIP